MGMYRRISLNESKDLLVVESTGEIIADTAPKFQDLVFEDYLKLAKAENELFYLEPMSAQELLGEKLDKYIEERLIIAEEKFDGHRGLLSLTSRGNRLFSKRVSKKSGWYKENSDNVPQIRDIEIPKELYGTVLDGEILLPIDKCTCRDVQSVTGALPETAIDNQLEKGFAYMNVFDILYYKGINIQKMPLWKRKVYLYLTLYEIDNPFLKMCKMYTDIKTTNYLEGIWGKYYNNINIRKYVEVIYDVNKLFKEYLAEGKEGIIIKDIKAPYEQKRCSNFVKMKEKQTFDVVIMDYEPPTKEYEGKELDTWEYFVDGVPVTKYFYHNWVGTVVFGVWKDGVLTEVGRTSGMTEEVRKMLSENKEELLGEVIEVEAQCIISRDTGTLQHPRFIQLREDKSSEMCTFEAHIKN